MYAVLTGTATSPPTTMPHHASIASAEFSMSVATRSPGSSPKPASGAASRAAASATSAADVLDAAHVEVLAVRIALESRLEQVDDGVAFAAHPDLSAHEGES